MPNALIDDEIGKALDAIRNKGAFVWFVIDACNSGTATRAVAPGGDDLATERKLDFADLGIPQAAVATAQAAAEAASGGVAPPEPTERQPAFNLTGEADAGGDATRALSLNGTDQSATGAEPIAKGGMVAFFAAQTVETTPEMPLPKGSPNAERYGLFTYTLFSKLAENPNMTYRQLGHAVLQQYTADLRQRPTPLFEGDLDARVFGSEKIDTVMQWPVEIKDNAATIRAGMLHRLAPGTKLAILPSPASELTETVGYLEVKTAKSLTSTVVPVAFNDKPAPLLSDLPPNAYARLSELAVDFKLKVARPPASDALKSEVAEVNAVLDAAVADKDKRFNIELVDPTAEADLRLAVLRENEMADAGPGASDQPALWFLPASGDVSLKSGQKPPLVVIGDKDKLAKGVGDNLLKIFRATSLARLAAASDYQPDQVSVQFQIKREDKDALEPLDASSVPIVRPGDQVHILAENKSSKLVDINILYVGSDYSITHIDAQRLVSGAKIEQGLLAFTDSSFGMERMIAILTEAPPQSEVQDLKFLEQGGVPPATRSAAASAPGFSDMLNDIGMAPATRSVMKLTDKSGAKGAVMIFPMETVPRQ